MTTDHHAQVPGLIAEYFKRCHHGLSQHPVITQTWTPGIGWKRQTFRKRVTCSWLRKLKGEGVTAVQVSADGYLPDFTIDAVLRHANRKLFGGRLI
jgi:hypothetical protein